MPLRYLKGIFQRCEAESDCCSRFCRPVPNHSAIAPLCSRISRDCKYRKFFIIHKKLLLPCLPGIGPIALSAMLQQEIHLTANPGIRGGIDFLGI